MLLCKQKTSVEMRINDWSSDVCSSDLMTPQDQAIIVGMYNDWLAKNRKPAEIAELHRMAGVAAGQPIPFMRRGDHPDAPRLRLDAELGLLTQVENDLHAAMKRFLQEEVRSEERRVGRECVSQCRSRS